MEVKENRPDACAASGTANSIYKDFSTDAPDIQEELTGPVLPDECAADIVSFCSEQTIAYDDLLEYLCRSALCQNGAALPCRWEAGTFPQIPCPALAGTN